MVSSCGGTGEYTVHRPEHWVFDQTELGSRATFSEAVPWWDIETDECRWNGGMDSRLPRIRDGSPGDRHRPEGPAACPVAGG